MRLPWTQISNFLLFSTTFLSDPAPVAIQDFPLRDKPMFLHIRRRRWLVESSGQVISRNWTTVAKGTRMTNGFAAFLKGLFGQLPDQQQ